MSSICKHLTILLALAALIASFPHQAAHASSVLDQSQETVSGFTPIYDDAILAQTLTPSVTGLLDRVDLRTWNAYGDPTGPGIITNVSIVETVPSADGPRPTGTVLAVVQVPQFVLGWNSIDFSAAAVTLNAATQYGIVLANTNPSYLAASTDTFLVQWDDNHYPGGKLWEWLPATGWAPSRFSADSPPDVADAAFRTFMASDPYDPSGQYWYGRIGVEDNAMPITDFGQLDAPATPGPWTLSYDSSDGPPEVEIINVTSASFLPHGWLNLQGFIGPEPWNEIVAANDHFIQDVARKPEEDPDTVILIRKDFFLTDSDVVGTYAIFGHSLDTVVSGADAEAGSVVFHPDHTFSVATVDADGNPGAASGTWAVDIGNSRLLLDVVGEGETIVPVGQGGLMMHFDIDPSNDKVGYDFLVKQMTGRTISEAEGQFLFQFFLTDEFGDGFTQWGVMDIQANGNWSLDATNVSGDSILITGTATMDDDGTIHALEDVSGRTHEMVISMDADLIVDVGLGEDETLGLNFLVRTVPEPATLFLFALPLLPALRRTRKESHSS